MVQRNLDTLKIRAIRRTLPQSAHKQDIKLDIPPPPPPPPPVTAPDLKTKEVSRFDLNCDYSKYNLTGIRWEFLTNNRWIALTDSVSMEMEGIWRSEVALAQ